ncbi:MAG: helix-turn-helix transcriptional regulator [Acholeplasma sp.]|nr:helix-turn-helix transcriptional regulator [Acholeplasma sp.]
MNKKIVLNLKEIRKTKQISQTELAKKLGISSQAVQQFENGNRTPSLERAVEIAQALEVTLDELIEFRRIQTEISKKYIKEAKEKDLD